MALLIQILLGAVLGLMLGSAGIYPNNPYFLGVAVTAILMYINGALNK